MSRERLFTLAGWATAAAALLVGVPLFVRMPPWCDLTLYDVAAWNLLSGGVHYRDVFDTNLPGFVWTLALIQATLGPSVEAVRLVDLAVVAGVVALLERLATWGGAGRPARAWFVAGVALFYPYTSEFNHAQRDVWMMLPALAAVALRCRRPEFSFRAATVQGVLWGLAVWVKPHVTFVAAAVWLATVPHLIALGWRVLRRDALGNFAGGAAVGLTGVAALVATGTWPHFVEVFTFWNAGYARVMWVELPDRFATHFQYFPPWGYLQLLTVPLAVVGVVDGYWRRPPGDTRRTARLLLAVTYLSWTAQALIVQRGFHYVHVPEILLLLALGAAYRWCLGFVMALVLAVTSLLVVTGLHPAERPNPGHVSPRDGEVWCTLHPLADGERLRAWPDCFRVNLSEEEYARRRGKLAMIRDFFPANDWPELAELAAELRRRGLRDGEVIAWDDAPHAVYRLAGLRPGFRFLHVRAMMSIGPEQEARILRERDESPARYFVSDLRRLGYEDPTEVGDRRAPGPDLLPPSLSTGARRRFPYTLRAVYRTGHGTGRYVLHER